MKKSELIILKKRLNEELERRNRINELKNNDLIKEFIKLNDLNINELGTNDKWKILNDLLEKIEIKESNGILVCIGNYRVVYSVCYQEYNDYGEELEFDSKYIEYQKFKDIETNKIHISYKDNFIEKKFNEDLEYNIENYKDLNSFCHKKYKSLLTSELNKRCILLNPYNSLKNENGFNEVRKDFFTFAIEKGQAKAKQLVLSKFTQMK